ncbi:MAG TPA: hypothetical protein VNU19_16770 [Candidatus Acidoferrum sp.]|nr:hypothetical protein [Candidatus Acidoferrum sp.]
MAETLEPHRDPDTISSFKRTINAAVLLIAARERPATQGGWGKVKASAGIGIALLIGHFLKLPYGSIVG